MKGVKLQGQGASCSPGLNESALLACVAGNWVCSYWLERSGNAVGAKYLYKPDKQGKEH